MSIITEYFNLHDKYVKIYGVKTLLLLQVGSFHEVYATDKRGPDIVKVANLLNLVCTKRNKSIVEVNAKNPRMVGFKSMTIDKYVRILIDNGYTVPVIDQTTPAPNPKRELTAVHSPGTYVDEHHSDRHHLVMMCIGMEKSGGNSYTMIGIASIDGVTGETLMHETNDTAIDKTRAMDEAISFMNQLEPKEILVHWNNVSQDEQERIIKYLHLPVRHCNFGKTEKEYFKIGYQNEFLTKVFNFESIVSPIENFDLERNEYMRNALLLLLVRCRQQSLTNVRNIGLPKKYTNKQYLNLGNNVVSNLNIIEARQGISNKSLFVVINKTSTPMGRRILKEQLLNPLMCSNVLSKRYDAIEAMIPHFKKFEKILSKIVDIERLNRKLALAKIHPHELFTLFDSYRTVIEINGMLQNDSSLKHLSIDCSELEVFLKKYETIFVLEKMNQKITEINEMFFKPQFYPDLDMMVKKISRGKEFMESLSNKLSQYVEERVSFNKNPPIRLKHNLKEGYYMTTTKRRCDLLRKQLTQHSILYIDDYEFLPSELVFRETSGNDVKITLQDMTNKNEEITSVRDELNQKIRHYYLEVLNQMHNQYNKMQFDSQNQCDKKTCNLMHRVVSNVATIDVIVSSAKTAVQNRYCRPDIEQNQDGPAYLSAKQLRHPIVEIVNYEQEYIAHDVEMGKDYNGILLYGLNSAGKSTIMKAIGLSIVMAQAGQYVPAENFKFRSFDSLFTRISGNDCIYRGLSSYALEILEVGAILKRNGNKTLVIGDEICRSTETTSGQIIVTAMIRRLLSTESRFIFATHMHELVSNPVLKEELQDKGLSLKHLKVDFCPKTNSIIYHRTLMDGNGPTEYGLNVAKSIVDDVEFLKEADRIYSKMTTPIVSTKKSRYNSKLYMTECLVCGYVPKRNMKELETHHIEPQRDTDDNGFILQKPHIHKNKKFNLVALCHTCHDKIDTGELEINGYQFTNKGKRLNVKQKC